MRPAASGEHPTRFVGDDGCRRHVGHSLDGHAVVALRERMRSATATTLRISTGTPIHHAMPPAHTATTTTATTTTPTTTTATMSSTGTRYRSCHSTDHSAADFSVDSCSGIVCTVLPKESRPTAAAYSSFNSLL